MDYRVENVLKQYAKVFEDFVGLPLSRQCGHTVPLIVGAQPFHVRPYRYPPILKDEIEKQIKDMLAQWVIQ